MELPSIGEHCFESTCHKLDFLPFKCNMCKKSFCSDHYKYEAHSCPESYKLDAQIPICPLCEQPVPNKPGEAPDLAVNEHLENNCKSKTRKIYNNKCSVKGCRQKEMVSVQCNSCSFNYCLRHRNPIDHSCKGPAAARRELTMSGSLFKNWFKGENIKSSTSTKPSKPTVTNQNSRNEINFHGFAAGLPNNATVSTLQGNVSEQEALNQALFASTQGSNHSNSLPVVSTSEDEALAEAIAASLEDENKKKNQKTFSDCSLS